MNRERYGRGRSAPGTCGCGCGCSGVGGGGCGGRQGPDAIKRFPRRHRPRCPPHFLFAAAAASSRPCPSYCAYGPCDGQMAHPVLRSTGLYPCLGNLLPQPIASEWCYMCWQLIRERRPAARPPVPLPRRRGRARCLTLAASSPVKEGHSKVTCHVH